MGNSWENYFLATGNNACLNDYVKKINLQVNKIDLFRLTVKFWFEVKYAGLWETL